MGSHIQYVTLSLYFQIKNSLQLLQSRYLCGEQKSEHICLAMKREGLSCTQLNSVCPAWLPSPCQAFPHLPILPYNSGFAPLFLCPPSLCFQSIPLSPLYSPSSHPVWIALLILSGLGLSSPSLSSTCPSYHLPSSYFTRPGMELPLHSRETGKGKSWWSRGQGWALAAWDTAVKSRAVSPSLSFFRCTSGAWGDWAMLCCFVLGSAWLARLCWSRFGFEMGIGPLLYPHRWAGLLVSNGY